MACKRPATPNNPHWKYPATIDSYNEIVAAAFTCVFFKCSHLTKKTRAEQAQRWKRQTRANTHTQIEFIKSGNVLEEVTKTKNETDTKFAIYSYGFLLSVTCRQIFVWNIYFGEKSEKMYWVQLVRLSPRVFFLIPNIVTAFQLGFCSRFYFFFLKKKKRKTIPYNSRTYWDCYLTE